jgi:hypothetical protein
MNWNSADFSLKIFVLPPLITIQPLLNTHFSPPIDLYGNPNHAAPYQIPIFKFGDLFLIRYVADDTGKIVQ